MIVQFIIIETFFNNVTPENGNDAEKIPHKNKPLSLFHINACSLSKHFDDLNIS